MAQGKAAGRGLKASAARTSAPAIRKANFVVNSALFEELGERLVSKPEIALAELIKNAYDADSPNCTLSLTKDRIIVADAGHGMTESEFLRNWMVVSTQNKGEQRFSRRYGRSMAGSKGVGRFSARFLGSVVTLISVAEQPNGQKSSLRAVFDWNAIARQGSVTEVSISYSVTPVESTVPSGTVLEISDLREAAKDIPASRVKTDILRLTDPGAGLEDPPFNWRGQISYQVEKDPGFSVSFSEVDQDGEDQSEASVAADLLNAYVGRVRLHVNEKGRLRYTVWWNRGRKKIAEGDFAIKDIADAYLPAQLVPRPGAPTDSRGLPEELAGVPHLPVSNKLHSPIFVDVRFFPKRKGTFSDLPVDGRRALSWISEHASLAVVDNAFSMPAYADRDSDWLAIDASKAKNERHWQSIFTPALYPISAVARKDPQKNPMLALPRGTQIVGRVHIATTKRPPGSVNSDEWLQPNMDRESLRANGAFRLLWHVSRFAVELLAHFDRSIRLKEEKQRLRDERQDAKTALSNTIDDLRASDDIEPEYRQRLVTRLIDAQQRLEEVEGYEQDARLSLELMSMMGVMAGFMTHEFEKALGSLKEAAGELDKLAVISPKLQQSADVIRSNEVTLANYLDYMRVFVSKAREARPQEFKSRAQVNLTAKTLSSLMAVHGIAIQVDIEPKLVGPHIPIAAYNGIVVNLLSNAMKALVPKLSNEPRRIRIYATNEGQRHTLVCADNGIGIPEYLRKRIWDPLFTTTADEENPLESGLGLGLSLVRQVVNNLGGRIELMSQPPPDFVTAFRVSLPLQLEP